MSDASPFEAFVREYQDMVFATAVRLLGREAEAEDVSQTVFLRAYEHWREIAPSPAAAGWLKTVARNLCLNHLARYRGRWQFFSEIESGSADGAAAVERLAQSPPADYERLELHQRLERALRALPDHQRVPLVLFHFEELSYEEIAAALRIPLSKVKSDIHRGRARLKTELAVLHGSR